MINRTAQTPDKEIARRLPAVERAVRDMKNKQFMGGENFITDITADATITWLGVTSGDFRVQIINFINPSFHDYYQSEPRWKLYIDVDNDASHHWPTGSALVIIPFSLPVTLNLYNDSSLSDEPGAGTKAYVLFLRNDSGNTRDYYFHIQLQFPAGTVAP